MVEKRYFLCPSTIACLGTWAHIRVCEFEFPTLEKMWLGISFSPLYLGLALFPCARRWLHMPVTQADSRKRKPKFQLVCWLGSSKSSEVFFFFFTKLYVGQGQLKLFFFRKVGAIQILLVNYSIWPKSRKMHRWSNQHA